MAEITITLPDGTERFLPEGSTGADLASSIGPGLERAALLIEQNGEYRDLSAPLDDHAKVKIVTDRDQAALEHIRHSTAHVLAQAVLELFPGSTFAGGPPIENGFYYDFELPGGKTFNDEDLVTIEARMREIIAADQRFERFELPLDQARELMADHPYKRVFMDLAAAGDDADGEVGSGSEISFYRNSGTFTDMCRGPHVPSTGKLGHFKLTRHGGAYFRGDENNPMLQRIYAAAFANKKDLAAHLKQQEEAAKRDHRRLGAELDLFSFPEEVGSGLAVFHPKGGIIRHVMENHSRARHEAAGYEFVYSPHISKENLFKTSGHLEWYADAMYPPMELDSEGDQPGQAYYLKPMNCPFHILIYRARQRSYRDLPLRFFEFGTVYRYEKSGVVHGLTRARGFAQDDAHIFTTPDQMEQELSSLLDFVLEMLRDYGLDDFYIELSTRPEGKAIGTEDEWERATEMLRSAALSKDLELVMDPGGGAFYAPKISVQARDAIGRTWQMSTIQVDMMLPERFDLSYVGSDGEKHRPIMIHRALFGSVERFFAVLLEHYAGAFPLWLAPVQAAILPVATAHGEYANQIAGRMRASGYRVEVLAPDETLGNRIRRAKKEKHPYVLVVGDSDIENHTVGVNPRGNDVERDVPLDDFLGRFAAELVSRGS